MMLHLCADSFTATMEPLRYNQVDQSLVKENPSLFFSFLSLVEGLKLEL